MKLLVTGFGPFPGMPDNPSARLIAAIDAGHVTLPPGCRVATAVIMTSWGHAAAQLDRLLRRHEPDFTLHFGVAATARGFRLERSARNCTGARADADGALPDDGCICAGAPQRIESAADVAGLAERLEARGICAEVSDDAGDYLCNMLFFHALLKREAGGPPADALFVHVPPPGSQIEGTGLLEGAEIIMRACAEGRASR